MRATESELNAARVTRSRARLSASLRSLGIDFGSDTWAWPTNGNYLTLKKVTWSKFCATFECSSNQRPHVVDILRSLAACWLTGCAGEFRPSHPATVMNRLGRVRPFLLLLLNEKHQSLETVTPREAQTVFCRMYFDGAGQCRVTERMLRFAIRAFRDLYSFRDYLPSALPLDPFPPRYMRSLCAHGRPTNQWTAPPEPVSLELIRQACRMLGRPADDIIRLRNKYIVASEAAKKLKRSRWYAREKARAALRGEYFSTIPGEEGPWTQFSAEDPDAIKVLIAALEGACAVVLLFLSGPRVSELLRAAPGCLTYLRHSNGIEYPYYVAQRSKQSLRTQPRVTGAPTRTVSERGWIQRDEGVRAIQVLSELSRPLRELSRCENFWLTVQCTGLWTTSRNTKITPLTPSRLNIRLNSFAKLSQLAGRTGWNDRLHSHMGRKACAGFMAKRDRTALGDLAVQFGHLSAETTDSGYGRPDTEFRRLLDDELAGEMQAVATELAGLDLDHTYARVGRSVLTTIRAKMSHFLGELRSQRDVRRILGQGGRLFPCVWGMCVYRPETSACKGSEFGPSDERRSPTVCRKCMNFLATEKHRPFWQLRVEDCERTLALRGLPEQTVLLIRLRLAEAREVLAAIAGGTVIT